MSAFPTFVTVYCEGRAQPVFSGVTPLPLVSESKLRKVFKTMFAQVRKVCLCVLKCEQPVPTFVSKLGGELHFTLAEALAPSAPPRPKAVVKRKVKRATKKVAKKILRAKRSMTKPKGKKRKTR
jgi:hypothetical protein